MPEVLEYTDSDPVPCRFKARTPHRKTHVDVVLHGAFVGLNARNIQRALRLPEDGTFVDVELVLRRKVADDE